MTGVRVKNLRDCFKTFGSRPEPVTREELAAGLGIENETDQRRLRDALKQMVRRGELTRYEDGGYRFVAEASPPTSAGEQWLRIYRAVRVAKGSFEAEYIGRLTVVESYKVKKDLDRLRQMGFLEMAKTEYGHRYLGTDLLRDTPEPPARPLIDRNVKSAMRRGREAAAELIRLFLTMEIDAAGTRKLIRRQLEILNEEFGKGAKHDSERD